MFMVLGMIVQFRLKSKFTEYGRVPTSSGLSGAEIAQKMLRDNGIYDVQVISTPGFLSDHYDPTKKTVNLSEEVYQSRTVAAAAVAAHECGHAVQHATAYAMLQLRSRPGARYTDKLKTFPVGYPGRTGHFWVWRRKPNGAADWHHFVCRNNTVQRYYLAGRV